MRNELPRHYDVLAGMEPQHIRRWLPSARADYAYNRIACMALDEDFTSEHDK